MDTKRISLLDDEIIKQRVVEAWEAVFSASNIVIQHAKHFRFDGMLVANPNIHQLLVPVRLLEQWIDVFLSNEAMEYDQIRMMLNAKQQLLRMEIVAAALEADNREDFDRAMAEIENQAQF